MFDSEKVTIERAAEFLECTEVHVLALLRDGRLPGVKLGKSWVIPARAFFTAVSDLAIEQAAKLRAPLPISTTRAPGRARLPRS